MRSGKYHYGSPLLLALATLCLLETTWAQTETIVVNFDGANGALPFSNLIADRNGNGYGTTTVGGDLKACTGGCGTVFKITPAGKESVLCAFKGSPDGSNPMAGLAYR